MSERNNYATKLDNCGPFKFLEGFPSRIGGIRYFNAKGSLINLKSHYKNLNGFHIIGPITEFFEKLKDKEDNPDNRNDIPFAFEIFAKLITIKNPNVFVFLSFLGDKITIIVANLEYYFKTLSPEESGDQYEREITYYPSINMMSIMRPVVNDRESMEATASWKYNRPLIKTGLKLDQIGNLPIRSRTHILGDNGDVHPNKVHKVEKYRDYVIKERTRQTSFKQLKESFDSFFKKHADDIDFVINNKTDYNKSRSYNSNYKKRSTNYVHPRPNVNTSFKKDEIDSDGFITVRR